MDYFVYDTCLLRLPVFPVETILSFYAGSGSSDLNDSLKIRELSDMLLADPMFREAVNHGAPETLLQYQQTVSDERERKKELERFLETFGKYLARMSSRTTPF